MEWKTDESRTVWVTNTLRHKVQELRDSERHSRLRSRRPYLADPSNYLADAYAEAAAVFERRLAELSPPPSA